MNEQIGSEKAAFCSASPLLAAICHTHTKQKKQAMSMEQVADARVGTRATTDLRHGAPKSDCAGHSRPVKLSDSALHDDDWCCVVVPVVGLGWVESKHIQRVAENLSVQ